MVVRRISKTRKRAAQQGGANTPGDIYVFYHIYCNHNTEKVVKDQIARIIISGLYKKLKAVKCFIAGEPEFMKRIKEILTNSGSKIEITKEGPNDTTYERFTLLDIKKHIKPEDKFLYIHSKGVNDIAVFSAKPAPLENIYWWRTWMEYFLIGQHEKALDALKTHDVVGVNYTNYMIGPHFSGNYWWSTGEYFMKLPNMITSGYNDPERYLFQAKPKHIDLYPENGDDDANRSKYGARFHSKNYVDV